MEYIIVISIIISTVIIVLTLRGVIVVLDRAIVKLYNLKKQIQEVRRYIGQEHKATRKETQELKTRATQDRKDLNDIQRKLRKSK